MLSQNNFLFQNSPVVQIMNVICYAGPVGRWENVVIVDGNIPITGHGNKLIMSCFLCIGDEVSCEGIDGITDQTLNSQVRNIGVGHKFVGSGKTTAVEVLDHQNREVAAVILLNDGGIVRPVGIQLKVSAMVRDKNDSGFPSWMKLAIFT